MIRANIEEAETHLSRDLERVGQGDVIVDCRNNRPVAVLSTVESALPRPVPVAGLLKGRVHWEPDAFAPMTDEDLAAFDAAPVFRQANQV